MADQRQEPRRRLGAIRIGGIAGVPVYVNWSWFVIALLIAYFVTPQVERISPGLGVWAYVAGFAFAVLLYVSVLLHEIAHVLVARKYGLPVRSITLQLLGGISEIEREPGTPWREFTVAVVGPLTSLVIGGVGFAVYQVQPLDNAVVELLVAELAFANLIVGVFNLLPGLPLDGGRILRAAVWALSKKPHLASTVAAWAGRVVAVLVVSAPWILAAMANTTPSLLMLMWSLIIAAFLWAGSSQALITSRIRQKLPSLQARQLARRALPVPPETSLSEAMRRAQEAGAGALVVVDAEGRPSALVSEAAVMATPEHRRPWLPVGDLARTLESGLVLPADLAGEELVRSMGGTPSTEYLLVEQDGSVYGVLVTADVDSAFSRA